LARPLASETTTDREPDRDLKIEVFSAKPEDKDREPDRDLSSEIFSVKLETKDREPVRALERPLT
jgi:hypothetical protein